MLNDHSMYEHILEDELFFGVIGMLECLSYLVSHAISPLNLNLL